LDVVDAAEDLAVEVKVVHLREARATVATVATVEIVVVDVEEAEAEVVMPAKTSLVVGFQ